MQVGAPVRKVGHAVSPSNRRRLFRGLIALGVAGFILALFAWFGWRYGFSPLPAPAPEITFTEEPPLARTAFAPDNCWFWLRELERRMRVDPQGRRADEVFFSTLDAWARSGTQPSASQAALILWLREDPEISRCFDGFLAATNTLPPAAFTSGEMRAGYVLITHALLRAVDREQHGETAGALGRLVEAWRFQARLMPPASFAAFYDERGVEQVNQIVARPWRRLALRGPAQPPETIRRLLTELAAVTNALPALDAAYARAATVVLVKDREPWQTDWRRVRAAFRQAAMMMSSDLLRLVQVAWGRLLDTRPEVTPVEGARRLGRPLGLLIEAWQRAAARPDDFAQVRGAWLSRTLDALRRDEPAPTMRRGWFREWFDRPAVWRSIEVLPPAEPLRTSQQQWLVYLESCRLTLALRGFREAHGRWPDRLEELVPEWLPAVPADPFGGRPFGYQREGAGWRLWSVGPTGQIPAPDQEEAMPQRVFRADGV